MSKRNRDYEFYLHTAANLHGLSPHWLDHFIEGAPALAPLLFPNLVLLAFIGLWAWGRELSVSNAVGA